MDYIFWAWRRATHRSRIGGWPSDEQLDEIARSASQSAMRRANLYGDPSLSLEDAHSIAREAVVLAFARRDADAFWPRLHLAARKRPI